MFYIQGRVFARGPDEAAMMVRDMYQEYRGKLVVKGPHSELDWYEYGLVLDWQVKKLDCRYYVPVEAGEVVFSAKQNCGTCKKWTGIRCLEEGKIFYPEKTRYENVRGNENAERD